MKVLTVDEADKIYADFLWGVFNAFENKLNSLPIEKLNSFSWENQIAEKWYDPHEVL